MAAGSCCIPLMNGGMRCLLFLSLLAVHTHHFFPGILMNILKTPSESAMRSNLWKLYLIQLFTGASIAMPIIVLFFTEQGLSLTQVFLLQMAFSVTLLLLEIPSGYLSDRWGRRHTTALGTLLYFGSYLVYATGDGFHSFLLGEIIMAAGLSCISGTLEALTYDTLLQLDDAKRYRAVAGKQYLLHFGAEAGGALLGGVLATISLRAPFWANLVPLGIACILAFTLREPARKKLQETRHWHIMWHTTTHTLVRHTALRSIVAVHAVIFTLALSLFWFTQPYQQLIHLPIGWYGMTHAVIVAAGAWAAWQLPKLERCFDDRLLLMGIATTVVACFLLLGLPAGFWGLAAFLCVRMAWGLLGPLTSDMVNAMADSSVRATVLSIRAFGQRALFSLTIPFAGMLAQGTSIPFTLLLWGAGGGVLLLLLFTLMRGVWKQLPS